MKGRLPLLGILGASATFLASLYLPWVSATAPLPGSGSGGISGLLNLTAGGFDQTSGWFSSFGAAAGLIALGVFAATALELAGRSGTFRLPLPAAAFALLFLSVMTALEVWNYGLRYGDLHAVLHRDVGMYLGLVSAAIVFVCAVGTQALAFRPRFSLSGTAGVALTGTLLAGFLVPQLTVHVTRLPADSSFIGYQLFSVGLLVQVAICVLACFSIPLWRRTAAARERLALTAAIALLTAGFLVPLRSFSRFWPWELWLLLACAGALLVLSLVTGSKLQVTRPRLADVATIAAAVIFLASLFLPWQKEDCAPGACAYLADGWSSGGGNAGIFTVLLLIGLLGYRRKFRELAVGAAVYAAAAGLEITSHGPLLYGALLGFAGATVLLVDAARHFRPIPQARFAVRIVPLALCLGFLSFIVGEMTRNLDTTLALQSPWRQGELAVAAMWLGLRLLVRWSDNPRDSDEVVLLPVALLAVTTLDLIVVRGFGISWGGLVSVFLCLVLALCGWVERYRGGLDRFRIPEEIWRIDRLPPVED